MIISDLSRRFGSKVSLRYIDLYSSEVSDFPQIVPFLIRGDSLLPILKLDDEEPLFGVEAVPQLIGMLEKRLG
ncbi:MAG: hypothetical protein C4521_10525 [Actinobacteria bacterium]|nr:MAG: hypothetical protein C4521_10525 [Actinomycetota bacterium]